MKIMTAKRKLCPTGAGIPILPVARKELQLPDGDRFALPTAAWFGSGILVMSSPTMKKSSGIPAKTRTPSTGQRNPRRR